MTTQKELIPMLAGDLLRDRRERLGLTLERAAQVSRIKLEVLAAIESGETGHIPSVYLRGYIRNYARAVDLDSEELEAHMEHVQGAEPPVQTVFTAGRARSRGEKWLKISSYLAASVLIAALAWQFTHEAVRFSQGESELAAGTVVTPDSNDQPGTEPVADTRSANTHLNASIASVELLQQRSELSADAAAEQAWAALGGQSETNPSAGGGHDLGISTSADSWVEIIDGDGARLEMDLIRAGNTREYHGDGPFQVMIGRASSVVLTLDGDRVDLVPFSQGDVARLTLGTELAAGSSQTPAPENRP
jgi:cytoskeleton protein RodZ